MMKRLPSIAVVSFSALTLLFLLVAGAFGYIHETGGFVEYYKPGTPFVTPDCPDDDCYTTDDQYLIWSRGNNGFFGHKTRVGPFVIYTP